MIGGFFSEIFAALEKKWQAFEEKYLVSFEELEDSDQEDDSDGSDVFDTGASAMAFHALSRPGLGTGSDREGSTKRSVRRSTSSKSKSKSKDKSLRRGSSSGLLSDHSGSGGENSKRRSSRESGARGGTRSRSSVGGGGGGRRKSADGGRYRVHEADEDLHGGTTFLLLRSSIPFFITYNCPGILIRQSSKASKGSSRRSSKDSAFQKMALRASKSFLEVVPNKKTGWFARRAEAAKERRKKKLKEQGQYSS